MRRGMDRQDRERGARKGMVTVFLTFRKMVKMIAKSAIMVQSVNYE